MKRIEFVATSYPSDLTDRVWETKEPFFPVGNSGINPAKIAYKKYPTIEKFRSDKGYRKFFEEDVTVKLGLGIDFSERIKPIFEIIPQR